MAQRYEIRSYDEEHGSLEDFCIGIQIGDIVQIEDRNKSYVYIAEDGEGECGLIELYDRLYESWTLPPHPKVMITFSKPFHPSHWCNALHTGCVIWFGCDVLESLDIQASQDYGLWYSTRYTATDSQSRWLFVIEETTRQFDSAEQVKRHMLSGHCFFEWRTCHVHVTICDDVHFHFYTKTI